MWSSGGASDYSQTSPSSPPPLIMFLFLSLPCKLQANVILFTLFFSSQLNECTTYFQILRIRLFLHKINQKIEFQRDRAGNEYVLMSQMMSGFSTFFISSGQVTMPPSLILVLIYIYVTWTKLVRKMNTFEKDQEFFYKEALAIRKTCHHLGDVRGF